MPEALAMPADLTQLLRREALSDYALACGDAQDAAEHCGAVTNATTEMLVELRTCRASVIVAAETLELVGDDVATAEPWDISLDDRNRDLITTRVRLALDRISGDIESSEQEILQAATRIGCLHAVLDKLRLGDDGDAARS